MFIVKDLLSVMMACLFCGASIAAEIRNVTAKQRFPWNGKVDITYEVVGDVAEGLPTWNIPKLLVVATNSVTGIRYVADANAISGDTGTAEGLHHVVWDLNVQKIGLKSDAVMFTVAYKFYGEYCVVDLSAGVNATSYPVTYLMNLQMADEYKTTKLVLRLIEPGDFKMCGLYDVTLTTPFYCAIFEVTQKQYSLVKGMNPSSFSDDKRPVESVSYDMIRGSKNGATWPTSSDVDLSSFIGTLRAKTGLNFDLPTEAQWEYACRAGTTTVYSYGSSVNGNYMWYKSNSNSQSHEVGTTSPNLWGLYDMHGNVSEWCLDWHNASLTSGMTNPAGPLHGSARVVRGGGWNSDADRSDSSFRNCGSPAGNDSSFGGSLGFRLVWTLSN